MEAKIVYFGLFHYDYYENKTLVNQNPENILFSTQERQGPIGAIIIFHQCVSQKHGFLFLEKC